MNWVDLILAIVILLCIIAGWSRGFIIGSLNLLSWIGSLVLGYLFYPYTANLLAKIFGQGPWLLPIAFILTAIVARLMIGIIVRFIIRAVPETVNQSTGNKFLGIIPGAINGFIYAIVISALLLAMPITDNITNETRNSRIAPELAMQAEWVNRKLAPVFNDAIRQTMNSLTVRPDSHESVNLPYKYTKAVPQPTFESEMLKLVNRERSKRGLKPLIADANLTNLARRQSQDMFVRGYFAHVNPDGKDPFDRMNSSNIRFISAGENLALAQTVEIAHTNLMNSPGHRANILNPDFGHVGIGIMDGGFHGLMISQEFTN